MVSVRLVEATLVPKLDWHTRPSPYPTAQQSVSRTNVSPALFFSPCCALLCLAYTCLAKLGSRTIANISALVSVLWAQQERYVFAAC